MQFCQPAFSGYAPNYNPYNPPPSQYNGYPEIIGEGHVTSVISPDGSIQYLFLPTTQWCRPQPCNSNFGNSNTQWNNGAWFIRSAYPPMQPSSYQAMCSPSYQGPCGFQSPLPVTSNSCIELHKPNYQVKFHNDGCTSTSDIHYFYPTLRGSNWFRKQRSSALSQTENSTRNSSCQDQEPIEVLCNQPCKCSNENKTKVEDMSYSSNSNTSTSKMSLEKCTEIKCQKYKKKKPKQSNHTCACYSKEDKTKEKVEDMSYSSNSNTSTGKISLDNCTEIKCQKYKTKKSSKKKKPKDSKHTCACYSEEDKTKEKVEDMSYSSNSNTCPSRTSLENCTEMKCQKYKTKKSSKKQKPKESKHTCACYSKEDKTNEKVVRICSCGNSSSADTMELTKSDESSQKKKARCKLTKAICKCYDEPQRVDKSVITFNEQGSNCNEELGRETQTKFKVDTGFATDINTDEQAKNPVQKLSYTICGDYESCFGTPSCSCYSTSETESDKRQCPRYSKRKKTK